MVLAMRALALTKNRVALDLYCIIEREMLARHESVEIADYTDDELSNATACLCCAVDTSRAAGVDDSHPAMQFLLFNITALVGEMEKRGMVKELQ
jgi:hypothetical protein